MGLDNIPNKYPCIDVAIKDHDGRIDCNETILARIGRR
jgi:hypothetical protein